MTRSTRTRLFILALVPVVVFAAVRCADSSAPLPVRQTAVPTAADLTARLAKLHEETDWVGSFHNDALRYVYSNLGRLPAKARDKRTLCETARRAYAEFHRARRGKPMPQTVSDDMENFCASGGMKGAQASVLSAPRGTAPRSLSAAAQTLMERIATEVDASTSFSDLNARVSAVESEAASTLSYDDAQAVFIVGSVARSSATYWANNVTSWVAVGNTPDYSVFASRSIVANPLAPPSLTDDFDWSDWAKGVWNDTKRAAKRAGGGDIRATAKVLVGTALAEVPVIWDVVIASAAAGSIMAVLQL